MNKEQMRVRFVPQGMKVREKEDGSESRTIEGCAIVFNQETVIWEGYGERECEQIAPSCVTDQIVKENDIKLNLLHKRDMTIARSNKGEGNLKIDVRADGVYFEAELPKCDICDRALEMVRAGVYTGCSFEFYPGDYTMEKRGMVNGCEEYLITHTSFERLSALTVGMDPAYEQTSVNAREKGELQREYEDLTSSERRLKEQEDAEREARHLLSLRERAAILAEARERVTDFL